MDIKFMDQVDKYFHGKMSEREKARFLKKVNGNKELLEDFKFYEGLTLALKDRKKLKFLELVKQAAINYERIHPRESNRGMQSSTPGEI